MSPVDVAAVKRAWPLAATLARRYGVPLRPDGGRRLRARCPLPGHERDRDPSFVVYAEQESFHCFGCGRGGDVITLVEAIEGVDFRAAVERLTAGRPPPAHGPGPAAAGPAPAPAPAGRRDAGRARRAGRGGRPLRPPAPADATALAYLRARGLDAATIARHRLGLAGGLAGRARPAPPAARARSVRAGLLRARRRRAPGRPGRRSPSWSTAGRPG